MPSSGNNVNLKSQGTGERDPSGLKGFGQPRQSPQLDAGGGWLGVSCPLAVPDSASPAFDTQFYVKSSHMRTACGLQLAKTRALGMSFCPLQRMDFTVC